MHVVTVERVEPIGLINDADILQRYNPRVDNLETSNNIKTGMCVLLLVPIQLLMKDGNSTQTIVPGIFLPVSLPWG